MRTLSAFPEGAQFRSRGRDLLERKKCLKNKGKTRGSGSLVTSVNNHPSFARSNMNITVNCTSSLNLGKQKGGGFSI